jgi:hypothetical protein
LDDSRESRLARASLKAREEVLKEVPTRIIEEALAAGEAFETAVLEPLVSSAPAPPKPLGSGMETFSGCATRVDFKNSSTTPNFVI